jgi:rubrerythrin
MKLETAIKTALEFEIGVHKTYLEAMGKTADEKAKRIFRVLSQEEEGHVAYLQDRLQEWQKTGKIKSVKLGTSIPKSAAIDSRLQELKKTVRQKATKQILEVELLKKALEAESKTYAFYKEMVGSLDGEGQELFQRFLEIEEGHQTIVRAELDAVSGWGIWFDTQEFRLEAE